MGLSVGLGLGLGFANGGGAAAFDLTTQAWDGLWWDFSAVPWVGQVGGNLASDGADPTVGTALNGHGVAAFSSQKLKSAGNLAAFATASAWTMAILCKPSSIPASPSPTQPYLDGCLWVNLDGIWGASITDQGARVWQFDGAYRIDTATGTPTAGAWNLLLARRDGTKIYTSLNGGAWSAGTSCDTSWGGEATTFLNYIGVRNTGVAEFFPGSIAMIGLAKTDFGTTALASTKSGINSRFGTSF